MDHNFKIIYYLCYCIYKKVYLINIFLKYSIALIRKIQEEEERDFLFF